LHSHLSYLQPKVPMMLADNSNFESTKAEISTEGYKLKTISSLS
jgi:hypothetical protein